MMRRWPWHRTRVLVLALLLAIGMSSAFVQGSLMAAEMAFSADAAPSGCDGCSGGDHGDADLVTCLSVCGSATQALLPGEAMAVPSDCRGGFQTVCPVLGGRTNVPDHGPPKILTVG